MLMRPSPARSKRLTTAQKRRLRAQAEAALEQLIAILDAIDGDPDFEPSLASTNIVNQRDCLQGVTDDREEQCEDEGFDSDTEPNGDERDFSQSEDDGPSYSYALSSAPATYRPVEIPVLQMDKDGKISFTKDGERWIGGRLNVPVRP